MGGGGCGHTGRSSVSGIPGQGREKETWEVRLLAAPGGGGAAGIGGAREKHCCFISRVSVLGRQGALLGASAFPSFWENDGRKLRTVVTLRLEIVLWVLSTTEELSALS